MKRILWFWLLVTALLSCISSAQASSVPFATGDGYFTTLGRETTYPSDYDHLTVTGNTGQISGTNASYAIASLLFTAGYNAWNIHTDTGSVSFNFAIGGTSATLTLPYTINISYTDTLSLDAGKLSLNYGGNLYNILTAPVTFSNVGLNDPRTANLMASISVSPVPLPPAFLLMLTGLGMLGFAAYRKGQV